MSLLTIRELTVVLIDYTIYTPVRSSHYNPEYGLDEIVSGFGGARRAFGPLRQSVG
jgi:hypothetical protein